MSVKLRGGGSGWDVHVVLGHNFIVSVAIDFSKYTTVTSKDFPHFHTWLWCAGAGAAQTYCSRNLPFKLHGKVNSFSPSYDTFQLLQPTNKRSPPKREENQIFQATKRTSWLRKLGVFLRKALLIPTFEKNFGNLRKTLTHLIFRYLKNLFGTFREFLEEILVDRGSRFEIFRNSLGFSAGRTKEYLAFNF